VDRLRKGKYKGREEIVSRMIRLNAEDDDVVAGPSSLSLKCPMSYVRIKVPSRSKYCVHSQCFDAESWFSVMEQTTTWLCPVCEKALMVDDLIVDGYFESILQATPDTVDDVIMEADGEWHTSDNKHCSAGWKATHLPTPRSSVVTQEVKKEPTPAQMPPATAEVLVIDSDEDEDEGRVKREVSPTFRANGRPQQAAVNGSSAEQRRPANTSPQDVIDLTLSDDESPPPPARAKNKRPVERDSSSPPVAPPTKRSRPNAAAAWLSPDDSTGSSNQEVW